MSFKQETTLEQFREEMQHRVVKYPLNSRPVKEALRFAKKHEDPAFYRIASDKIHAQRQFQRELYGPGRLERLIDFVSLGSLREVVVTLVLVAGGVVGLDVARRALQPAPVDDLYAHMDVEKLAEQLGLALETSRVVEQQTPSPVEEPGQGNVDDAPPTPNDQAGRLSDADVARIAEAVIQRLANQRPTEAVNTTGAEAAQPVSADETTSLAAISNETTRN